VFINEKMLIIGAIDYYLASKNEYKECKDKNKGNNNKSEESIEICA
jgi:hypothetical protein